MLVSKGLPAGPPGRYVAGVFWLLRPPYLRWVGAAALVAVAALFDVAGSATEPFPFASESIASGAPVDSAIEWRDVPRGLLPAPADPSGFAARRIDPGEPLTAGAVRATGGIPAGWWSVPVDLPESAQVGTAVRLVSPESNLDVRGIVAQPTGSGAFATTSPGLVAVAPGDAAAVAAAVAQDRLIVLMGG